MKLRQVANTLGMNHELLARSVIKNTTEINGIRFGAVDISLLKVDRSYQRDVDKEHLAKLVMKFNKKYLNCLIVSYRDGYFYIIDGQHRYEAAKAKGLEDMACIIFTDLTAEEEARMFKDLNTTPKALSPYKIFWANIFNGDTTDPDVVTDLAIKRICDKHHVEIKKASRGFKGKILRCLSRARQIVNKNGDECFEWILDFINSTNWADDSYAYTRECILMLRNYWVDNKGDEELEKRLMNVINSTTPNQMIIKAKHDYPKHGIEVAMGLCLRDMIESK